MLNKKKDKIKGIWLYGLSGSGKTFISNYLFKKINNSILIDGDLVRKYISTDLGYAKKDREIQISRVLGISILSIKSKKFPIASTVYFNKKMKAVCLKNKILPLKVERKKFYRIIKTHKTYKNKNNVVGKDIFYDDFKTEKIINYYKNDLSYNSKIKLIIKRSN